jgi:hypothetical protein
VILTLLTSFFLRFRVSPPIRQALSAYALKQLFRAHRVVKPELLAMVVAEVEFRGVAVQVVRAANADTRHTCRA